MATAVEQYLADRNAKIDSYKSAREQQIADFKAAHGMTAPAASGTTPAAASAAPANTAGNKPNVQASFKAYDDQNQANIGQFYDTGLAAQKQGLLDAYNANMAAQAAQGQQIQQNYGGAIHDVGVQNARNAGNVTQFADVRRANTGAGSQHRLNLGNAMANSAGLLEMQRAAALRENERQQQVMTADYQNRVSAAIADNDYKKAAALLDDYQNNQKWQDEQAAILASYGNFDPYRDLYGEDAAKGMQQVWAAQNPQIAYRTGAITANQYRLITGHYPLGYSGGGGGGNDWYDPTGGSTQSTDPASIGAPGGGGIVRGAKASSTSVAPRSSGNINTVL